MEELVSKVAASLNLDEELVNKIVRSQFKFVKDVMESGNEQSVHMPYFGKMAIKPRRLDYLPDNFKDNIHKSGKEIMNNPVD